MFTDVTSGEKKEIDLLAQCRFEQQDTCFLIHVENQSYTETAFAKRMFKYFARLYEKYDCAIYPVVIFSFDEPKRAESTNHSVRFPDLNVLDFNFKEPIPLIIFVLQSLSLLRTANDKLRLSSTFYGKK
ncbi:MAG: hypothetical protein ACYTXL_21100 [Nostoc sp.]